MDVNAYVKYVSVSYAESINDLHKAMIRVAARKDQLTLSLQSAGISDRQISAIDDRFTAAYFQLAEALTALATILD